jgi:hypothetical protein
MSTARLSQDEFGVTTGHGRSFSVIALLFGCDQGNEMVLQEIADTIVTNAAQVTRLRIDLLASEQCPLPFPRIGTALRATTSLGATGE